MALSSHDLCSDILDGLLKASCQLVTISFTPIEVSINQNLITSLLIWTRGHRRSHQYSSISSHSRSPHPHRRVSSIHHCHNADSNHIILHLTQSSRANSSKSRVKAYVFRVKVWKSVYRPVQTCPFIHIDSYARFLQSRCHSMRNSMLQATYYFDSPVSVVIFC